MTIQNATQSLPVISDATEAHIITALELMYDQVRGYGKPLPPLAEILADANGRERVVNRANRALTALHEHRKEEKVRAFRQGVPYVDTWDEESLPYTTDDGRWLMVDPFRIRLTRDGSPPTGRFTTRYDLAAMTPEQRTKFREALWAAQARPS